MIRESAKRTRRLTSTKKGAKYPEEGGTYDPTGASDDGVLSRDPGKLGEAPPVPPKARGQLKYSTVNIILGQEPVAMEDLSGTIVHETKHMADRIEPVGMIGSVADVERLYHTNFIAIGWKHRLKSRSVYPAALAPDKSGCRPQPD